MRGRHGLERCQKSAVAKSGITLYVKVKSSNFILRNRKLLKNFQQGNALFGLWGVLFGF